jgi:hypothetical protein
VAQVEQARLQSAIAAGVRNEARLTNVLFHARHPELRGRRILPGETALAQEWRMLRERVVRPALARGPAIPGAVPAAAPVPGVEPGAPCAKEDPVPDSMHTRGRPCAPDGRKCWPREAWNDILDSDMPCNGEDQRSPAAYNTVLDYFNVEHPQNLRYVKDDTIPATYCNIYVHDVTRAMRASIPHWVRDLTAPKGRRELDANATFDWLLRYGASIGWIRIDSALTDWVNQQFNRRQSLPFVGGVLPAGILRAGNRIAAASHANPSLLRQDSYLAQQFADLGLPTVIAARNPNPRRPGHVAMVRPETPALRGALHSSGVFLPLSAQAGGRNFEKGLARWIVDYPNRLFFVHA